MINPNWDIFKAKFSDNPQKYFEWLCYILFCIEFNKIFGIFRFKNQSAIETNPIEINDQVIGWQAKFFDSTLSNHKPDLIRTLIKAKRDYPSITKLILYTNQEWARRKGQEPQAKKDIDKKALELKIEIEWRTASFFESPFVVDENQEIAKHFFVLDKSIINVLSDLKFHSENILADIRTSISFNNTEIEINRENEIEAIRNSQNQALILSGLGGVGKTAIAKKLFEQLKDDIPIYIFKASEFDLRSIAELYPNFDLNDFINAHKDEKIKYIIIDSSEKLLDLRNTDPFKEFLSVILKNGWKVLFTTRNNYLEVLNFQLLDVYNILPKHVNIPELDTNSLNSLSKKHAFLLPKDEKLFEYIKNPFYLNEYLKFYRKNDELVYSDFRNKLWNLVILKSKPAREQCFIKLSFERVNSGQFFINPNCESQVLESLRDDGILGYESPYGYFINHDIHEEWALEKILDIEYVNKTSNQAFFTAIGSSLPIRRAFRKWLSEKQQSADNNIKSFIEQSIEDNNIESFWKDEILVAVLLSEYSSVFFEIFKDKLLFTGLELLKKLSFLLRIACKEIDDNLFNLFGLSNTEKFSLDFFFTKPKGHGWNSFIEFIFKNLDSIGIRNIFFVLPIIFDWSSQYKIGATTRYCGLIALRYYQWTIDEDVFISNEDRRTQILQTILYSSAEIKNELEQIFKEIIEKKWKHHRDPYYDLSRMVLTKFEGALVSKVLPSLVIELADLFWWYTGKGDDFYRHHTGVEHYFGLEDEHMEYFPASSLQTPIYSLLQSSLQETVDFILRFTNKCAEQYSKSSLDRNAVEEVKVYIDQDKLRTQYISNRLWCTYRGTQVNPHVLESMHMALERYFLEGGKLVEGNVLESWLFYLLRNSSSASISAIVASIVVAYPDKTFNVASILFKTKEFFMYDTARWVLDQTAKSSILSLQNFAPIARNRVFDNERIKACDEKHRTKTLESLALEYQLFRNVSMSEEESERRQKVIWQIIDDYYKVLSDKPEDAENEKTWRLYLARMDRRKMKVETEKIDTGVKITFNPEIDDDLRDYSEESSIRTEEFTKYTSLGLWAKYKSRNDEKCKEYHQYENDPKLVLKLVKEILEKLKSIDGKGREEQNFNDQNFKLFNQAIPIEACSVLLKFYFNDLSKTQAVYCSNVILEAAELTIQPDYHYQTIDGTDLALSVLAIIFDKFPKHRSKIKKIILLNLFNEYPIDMSSTRFNVFSIQSILELWSNYFEDAYTLLFGYLILKPKHDDLYARKHRESYESRHARLSHVGIFNIFLEENKRIIQSIIKNKLKIQNLGHIEKIDLRTLSIAFQSLPLNLDNVDLKNLAIRIISVFAVKISSDDRDDRFEYRYNFIQKLTYLILKAPKEDIPTYLKPILDKFEASDTIADLLVEFIYTENRIFEYENFWLIWISFKDEIIKMCEEGDGYGYVSKVIRSYLFAQNQWKDTSIEWHSMKSNDSKFFEEISDKIGHCPSVLYSISKLLNDFGHIYLDQGIYWISNMLKNNKSLWKAKLEVNTIYYLENIVRKYIYSNKEKIKKSKDMQKTLLVILDFLIENISVVGYMARESIL